ncbi:MAG: DUF4349 domain-containing protein [Oscillospiraceae bacterium]|nr:DUF4349 domain-containing protein [Oscillospiraceae bacterium]
MKRRGWVALCTALLVMCLSLAACAAAPVRSGTPAAAPAPETAVDGDGFAFAAQEMGWSSDDAEFGMSPDMPMAQADVYTVHEAAAEEFMSIVTGGGETSVIQPVAAGRMIVTTVSLHTETMDFDGSVSLITSMAQDFGGFIENSSVGGRSIRFDDHIARNAHFTVRVPTERIHDFVAQLSEHTNVVSRHENADDITDRFFDSRARLASLVNQESLLTDLLEREGAELEYILEVHRELANVRHQIELLHASLQRMESAVNFSTAHIGLEEVMQYRQVDDLPTSFGERVGQAATSSWANFTRQSQNSVVNFVWMLPFHLMNLLTFAFWVAVVLVIRRVIRKKKGLKKGERTFVWMNSVLPPRKSNTNQSERDPDTKE